MSQMNCLWGPHSGVGIVGTSTGITTMLFSLLMLTAPAAHATVPDVFGLGAANMGMGGAVTATVNDPFAAYYNPAALGRLTNPTLVLGGMVSQANLQSFQGIVYDTDSNGDLLTPDNQPDYGAVGTDYNQRNSDERSAWYNSGSTLGAAFPIMDHMLDDTSSKALRNMRVTLGMAMYLPVESTLRMQMEDPQIPYYVMYRNRNNRFTIHPAVGVSLGKGVYVGGGGQLLFNTTARIRMGTNVQVDSFPSEDGDSEELQVRVQADVEEMVIELVPSYSPIAGVMLRAGEMYDLSGRVGDVLDHTSVGATYRHSWFTNTSADVLVAANGEINFDEESILVSSLLEDPIHIELQDMIGLYNPPALSLGFATGTALGAQKRSAVDVSFDLTHTWWSQFSETVPPYQEMVVESLAGSSITVRSGTDYGDPGFSDTWALRIGGQLASCWSHCGKDEVWAVPAGSEAVPRSIRTFVRGGFGYVPSPVPAQSGLTNYMDSDRTVLAGGLGFELHSRRVGPVRLDIGGQHHTLAERTFTKDPGLVSDNDNDGVLEYPRGYPLEGKVTSAGSLWAVSASLEMRFGTHPHDHGESLTSAGDGLSEPGVLLPLTPAPEPQPETEETP